MHRDGFVTRVDETTTLGQQQAHYLRTNRREATETAENGLTVFRFPPGSTCFNTHHKRLDREPFYRIEGGTGRIQVTADEWQHRQATTLEAYKTAQERG